MFEMGAYFVGFFGLKNWQNFVCLFLFPEIRYVLWV